MQISLFSVRYFFVNNQNEFNCRNAHPVPPARKGSVKIKPCNSIAADQKKSENETYDIYFFHAYPSLKLLMVMALHMGEYKSAALHSRFRLHTYPNRRALRLSSNKMPSCLRYHIRMHHRCSAAHLRAEIQLPEYMYFRLVRTVYFLP